jgi:hypothetical protein
MQSCVFASRYRAIIVIAPWTLARRRSTALYNKIFSSPPPFRSSRQAAFNPGAKVYRRQSPVRFRAKRCFQRKPTVDCLSRQINGLLEPAAFNPQLSIQCVADRGTTAGLTAKRTAARCLKRKRYREDRLLQAV